MSSKLRAAKATVTGPTSSPTREPASAYPVRRRPKQIAMGAALMVVCALIAGVLLNRAGDRREVVVLARPVDRYHVLERSDLTTARVAADGVVDVIDAAELEQLVGRVSSLPLSEGALLGERELLPVGHRAVAEGQEIVGVQLGTGASPVDVRPGMRVRVVVRAATSPVQGGSSDPVVVEDAWVYEVGPNASGGRTVSVVVPAEAAPTVVVGSAEDRAALIVTEP